MEDRLEPTVYEPSKLIQLDLDNPVTRNQRALPGEVLDRLREDRLDREDAWSRFNARTNRRLQLYPIGAVLCLPILFFFLLPTVSFSIFHPFIYALFGLYVGFMRPMRLHSGLALLACAVLVVLTTSKPAPFNLIQIFYGVLGVIGVGFCIGVAEESKLSS